MLYNSYGSQFSFLYVENNYPINRKETERVPTRMACLNFLANE